MCVSRDCVVEALSCIRRSCSSSRSSSPGEGQVQYITEFGEVGRAKEHNHTHQLTPTAPVASRDKKESPGERERGRERKDDHRERKRGRHRDWRDEERRGYSSSRRHSRSPSPRHRSSHSRHSRRYSRSRSRCVFVMCIRTYVYFILAAGTYVTALCLSLSLSLFLFLPPSLPPFLPPSLPPSFPLSLPPFLPPSHPPNLVYRDSSHRRRSYRSRSYSRSPERKRRRR